MKERVLISRAAQYEALSEYKENIDGLNADELLEIVRLSRLTDEEKTAFEEVDVYEHRLKDVEKKMCLEPRQLGKVLQRARDKVIRRVLKRPKKGLILASFRRSF